jgi:hypothetical protein
MTTRSSYAMQQQQQQQHIEQQRQIKQQQQIKRQQQAAFIARQRRIDPEFNYVCAEMDAICAAPISYEKVFIDTFECSPVLYASRIQKLQDPVKQRIMEMMQDLDSVVFIEWFHLALIHPSAMDEKDMKRRLMAFGVQPKYMRSLGTDRVSISKLIELFESLGTGHSPTSCMNLRKAPLEKLVQILQEKKIVTRSTDRRTIISKIVELEVEEVCEEFDRLVEMECCY